MSENTKNRLIKEQNRCQSIKLNAAFPLGEEREKSGMVTFSKVDSCTQVRPLENSVFGYDGMVHLHRDCTRNQAFSCTGEACMRKERWQLHRWNGPITV